MTRFTRKSDRAVKHPHAPFAFEDSVIIATNVERLMAEQNYDKKKFSEVANIARPTLNKMLRGEGDMKLSTIRKAAAALGVKTTDLFATPPKSESPRTHL